MTRNRLHTGMDIKRSRMGRVWGWGRFRA
jgi:hypothetical protein